MKQKFPFEGSSLSACSRAQEHHLSRFSWAVPAYESTLIQQRKDLHTKVAQSIEKIFRERLQEFYGMLAFHYSKADDLGKAEEYMEKAGEEALRSSASSEALQLYHTKHGNNAGPEF